MRKLSFFLSALAFAVATAHAQSTCPPGYVPRPWQDCSGAINVCQINFTQPSDELCGHGLVPDELGTQSCLLTNERTTTWFVFEARTAGRLRLLIIPSDAPLSTPDAGDTDYDFALIKLPAGQENTAAVCATLAGLSGNANVFVSCNYSGGRGITGITDSIGLSTNTGKFNDEVVVSAGDRFLLAVDNFTSAGGVAQIGYQLQFGERSVNPALADITAGLPVIIANMSYDPACQGACPVTISLNRQVLCNQLTAQVYDPANLSRTFNTSVLCTPDTSGYADRFTLITDMPPADTTLVLVLRTGDPQGLYSCEGATAQADSILLKPRRTSFIVAGAASKVAAPVSLAPNPFSSSLRLDATALKGGVSVRLIAANGAVVFSKIGLAPAQTHTLELPKQLPPGFYQAEVSEQGGKRYLLRLSKQ